MRITVLSIPDCAHTPVMRQRLTAAVVGRAVEVQFVEVHEEADAVRWGMTGSPTVLFDGNDPFADAGAVSSFSCRIYRGPDGETDGAPSVGALQQALTAAGLADAEADWREPDLLDPIGRGGRGRLASVERGLRAVHQAVLRQFAENGHAPGPAALEPFAATAGRSARDVLAELAREDFLTLNELGQVKAAYPFSAVPTPHRVRIDGGAEVWSMCAIDALGISPMLGKDVEINSVDPVSGDPVTVTSRNGQSVWEPASAVVVVGRRSGSGPAADVCCDALNFFTDVASAESWVKQHPAFTSLIVDQAGAEDLGRQTFGPLLTAEPFEASPRSPV